MFFFRLHDFQAELNGTGTNYLQTDEDLARQLREHLRPTHVLGKLYAGNFLHSGGEVTELLSEQANWEPGWELLDKVVV